MNFLRTFLVKIGICSERRSPQMQAIYRNQAVVEFDVEGCILFANDKFLRLMGYSLTELRGKHHSILLDTNQYDEKAHQEFWGNLGSGKAFVGRCKRRKCNGQVVWLQANYNPVLNSKGLVVRVVKYAMDISTEVFREDEARSQLAAVGQAQAVIEFSLDGHILRCNRNFLDVMGFKSEDELVGKHHRMFVSADEHNSPDYIAFWSQLAKGQHYRGQFRRVGHSGRDVWIEANYSPVLNQSGEPFKVVKYATDITARFEATRLVHSAFEQLQQLVRNSAAQALEAHDQTKVVTFTTKCGDKALDSAIEAMKQVRVDSQRIGEMVGLINDIAFQTNLLALNAAVESARAGDHGRGFAVVASEVRNLARRSAEAAQEVKAVIASSAESVKSGFDRVNESGEMMKQMRTSAVRASVIMDGIIQASKAQDSRLGAVKQAVLQLESTVLQE